MTKTLSRTELIRRARLLAAQTRAADNIPSNYRYAVGLRTNTVYLSEPPTSVDECYHPQDDLWDHIPPAMWAQEGQSGEIVHLYFWEPGEFGQLACISTGWIGTADHPPLLICVPGVGRAFDGTPA